MKEIIVTDTEMLEFVDQLLVREFGDICVITRYYEQGILESADYDIHPIGRISLALRF